ncbi:calnexin isoform X2 [Rhincodon typus]|uniref:calnexin isoform X2 n=1 Tax=Rhincodon typus TaxID=259920 RepID=UPI00202F575A|nr:calnexin isoform X2 [Rhincodon typus]
MIVFLNGRSITAVRTHWSPILILSCRYEVRFQNEIQCGGAYLKLLSEDDQLDLRQFFDKTPYTIMFGPDKCGQDYKLHFIFRHRDPVTGAYEEKHARKPEVDLQSYFIDKRPHLYTLIVRPDNSFEILIDENSVSKGSLLQDMTPPVNPPNEIDDPNHQKPEDWDDRRRIPNPDSVKPHDWDEDAPPYIPDSTVMKPDDWLDEEPEYIPDPKSKKPPDWDIDMDGEWEEPKIPNPKCKTAGCGTWKPPMIPNPAYKGKWKVPMIDNPKYKPGLIMQLFLAADKRPWLWGVYVFTVALPVILFISFYWPNQRFGPPDDYYYKKTDDVQLNDEEKITEAQPPESALHDQRGNVDKSKERMKGSNLLKTKVDLETSSQAQGGGEPDPGQVSEEALRYRKTTSK